LNTLAYAGYVLVLIGGIIIIISGLVHLLGSAFLIFSPLAFLSRSVFSLITIAMGLVCAIGSKQVVIVAWAAVLLILGVLAGGIGGTLVVIGALLGLLSKLIKT
jgi:hypothetical protein